MTWRRGLQRLLLGGLSGLALLGCPKLEVTRLVDGVAISGRYVSPRAYAAYARGVEAEERGDDAAALSAYLAGAAADDESVELQTRIGGVYCSLRRFDDAAEAFAEAEELVGRYEPLWRARARCAAARGEHDQVLELADRAARADPLRQETILLFAEALEGGGALSQAGVVLREAVVLHPHSAAVWEALLAFSTRRGDSPWVRHAAERLAALKATRRAAPLWAAVDEALAGADLALGRKLAMSQRIDPRLLAPRAIALGQPALAKEQAELLLAANPSDSDARVALALAAELLGDSRQVAEVLELPTNAAPLSPVGSLLLAELLSRHAGAEVSTPLLEQVTTDGLDGLERDLADRLTARLQRPAGG